MIVIKYKNLGYKATLYGVTFAGWTRMEAISKVIWHMFDKAGIRYIVTKK